MSFAGGVLMALTGLALMGFGLFLFYAWLPLLYALVGADIGLLIGRSFTGEIGATAVLLALVGAIVLGAASYMLEPYRRILIGVSAGVLMGLTLAHVFGLEGAMGGIFGFALAAILGLLGGIVVPRYFDLMIIVAAASSGAALLIAGMHIIVPGVNLFDHTGEGLPARILTVVLTVLGIIWQFKNIAKWVNALAVAEGVGPSERK